MDGKSSRRGEATSAGGMSAVPLSRLHLVEQVVTKLADAKEGTSVVRTTALVGVGGAGKSTIVKLLRDSLNRANVPVALVVLDAASSRSPLRLLGDVARQIDRNEFAEFLRAITAYQEKSDLLRQREYQDIVVQFKEGMAKYAAIHDPVVLMLDNLEAIGHAYRRWLVNTLEAASENIRLVVSTRDISHVKSPYIVELLPFKLNDIVEISKLESLKLSGDELVRIERLTGGNPLRVQTVFQAVSEGFDIATVSDEKFETFIDQRIKDLPRSDRLLLTAMAIARLRFDLEFISRFMAAGYGISEADFVRLDRFPFVTRRDGGIGRKLHDDFVGWISSLQSYRPLDERQFIEYAISEYYDPKILATDDDGLRRQLVSEKLAYTLRVDPQSGLAGLIEQVTAALSRFDFDRTESLLATSEQNALPEEISIRIALLRAEYLLKKYDSKSSIELLESLSDKVRVASNPSLQARYLELTARCTANPVPIPHGDILRAVDLLREASLVCEMEELVEERRTIHFALATALRSAGQSQTALDNFEVAFDWSCRARDSQLAVRCLDERVQTLRLMQDLPSARLALDESYRYRVEHNVSEAKGITDYYAGNIYRDSNDFVNARVRYENAQAFLIESGDDNTLCCLYADWAWLEYLDGSLSSARERQMESFRLATAYRFGTELAEHWHTMFHLERDAGELSKAYEYLDMGLAEAKRSSNMYMILDCSMHSAQRALFQGDTATIEYIVEEMEAYERRGCGIRVFRGRTLVILGDAYYRDNRHSEAYDQWREGLVIVAKFGNSRSNVELFDDIFGAVEEQLRHVVSVYGLAGSLKRLWAEEELHTEFPAITSMCNDILANSGGER
jgi:tetratricopeptide (TPR) repeat protein